ncbi:MAG: MBL fold metallo-hydrolase [Oscillospiraceae bacterium]
MRKKTSVLLSVLSLLLLLCGCVPEADTPELTLTPVPTSIPTSTPTPTPTSAPAPTPTPAPVQPVSGDGLTVHFIDVGQADCALLQCDGQTMLIDGGNAEDSSLVVSYLRNQGVEYLDYVVCTHAHEDHVGGLSGPLNTCTVGQVFAPVTQYDSKVFSNFVKYTDQQGLEITIPQADSAFDLGQAQVTVLGPRKEYEDTNNTSIVLRVDYGETSFLFTGDMESAAEQDLLNVGCDLGATVLKVGHHGSSTSSSYVFLREVMPEYAVISVGKDNSYGHPHEEVMSRLYDAQATVYRTDEQGTVVAFSDGEKVTFTTEKDIAPTVGRDEAEQQVYIGNLNSHVFHRESCTGLPAEKNRVYFDSRDAAVAEGYTPCGRCDP